MISVERGICSLRSAFADYVEVPTTMRRLILLFALFLALTSPVQTNPEWTTLLPPF